MNLHLTKNTETEALREAFMDAFDGLKIEFFNHSHQHEQGSPKQDMLKASVPLVELNEKFQDVELTIEGDMTVNQVEDFFENQLGLHIQVFRKMNISWIETTATDRYTLDEQMRLSRESRGLS